MLWDRILCSITKGKDWKDDDYVTALGSVALLYSGRLLKGGNVGGDDTALHCASSPSGRHPLGCSFMRSFARDNGRATSGITTMATRPLHGHTSSSLLESSSMSSPLPVHFQGLLKRVEHSFD